MSKHPYWPDLTDAEGDVLAAYLDATCGDCVEGRCHWGGSDPLPGEACECARHGASVAARAFAVGGGKGALIDTALAFHQAVSAAVDGEGDGW